MSKQVRNTAVFAVVLAGLFWIDPLFLPLALFGPVATGLVAGPRGVTRPAAAAWAAAGLLALLSDWVINDEDQLFHLVLTVVTAGVVLGVGGLAARVAGRRSPRTA